MDWTDRAPDPELLAAFAGRRDEAAFELLVRRHGGMVLRVCRSVLGQNEDAADAAQAAFVVLARRSGKLKAERSLAPWLHAVAHAIAVNALRNRKRRVLHERKAGAMSSAETTPVASLEDREQSALLHGELEQLPDRHRRALVLFHLEGRSLEETARLLDCPVSTAGNWLARGRQKLHERLARRGMVLSVGAVTALLSAEGGAAELPASLVAASVKAAVWSVSGSAAAAGVGSSQAALLAKGALKAMFYAKLKLAAAVLLAVSLVGSGTGVALWQASAEENQKADGPSTTANPGTNMPPVTSTAKATPQTGQVSKVDVGAASAPTAARPTTPSKKEDGPQADPPLGNSGRKEGRWVHPATKAESKPAAGTQKVTLEFTDTTLDRVADMISRVSGQKIQVDRAVADLPVSLKCRDMPVEQALNMIAKMAGCQVERTQDGFRLKK